MKYNGYLLNYIDDLTTYSRLRENKVINKITLHSFQIVTPYLKICIATHEDLTKMTNSNLIYMSVPEYHVIRDSE